MRNYTIASPIGVASFLITLYLDELRCAEMFAAWLQRLRAKTRITHDRALIEGGNKDPSSRAALERTVGYLARYANRVAIANSRLIGREDGDVLFSYKDYQDHGRRKT